MKKITLEVRETAFLIPAIDLIAVQNAVSKEESRYYLRGVFVETLGWGHQVNLVATDGHILLRKVAPDGAFVGLEVTQQKTDHESGFILSVDVTEKAFKAKALGDLWIYGDSATGILEFLDITDGAPRIGATYDRLGVCEFSRIDGTFPEWRRVLPKDGAQGAEHLAYDPANMAKLYKAGALYARNNMGGRHCVKMSADTESDPIRVEFSAEADLLGVIMPMRF